MGIAIAHVFFLCRACLPTMRLPRDVRRSFIVPKPDQWNRICVCVLFVQGSFANNACAKDGRSGD